MFVCAGLQGPTAKHSGAGLLGAGLLSTDFYSTSTYSFNYAMRHIAGAWLCGFSSSSSIIIIKHRHRKLGSCCKGTKCPGNPGISCGQVDKKWGTAPIGDTCFALN